MNTSNNEIIDNQENKDDNNDDSSTIMKGGEAEKAKDYANYFSSYAFLYHQKQMLEDKIRMSAYHSAIQGNVELFKDAIVLDVGAGSGILSLWAAQMGARKVYAIEYTDIAKMAEKLMEFHNVQDRVQVIQSSIEDIDLETHLNGEKVDIIISEWMGYFLLRESMLDSVIRARNRLLKDDGFLFPSHATMYLGLISNEDDRIYEQRGFYHSLEDWHMFIEETKELFGVDMSCFNQQYKKEQKEYYILSSLWRCVSPNNVVSDEPSILKEFNLNNCNFEDIAGIEHSPIEFNCKKHCVISGFIGWFTTDFKGNNNRTCPALVTLDTSAYSQTHWGQQVFYLDESFHMNVGDSIKGWLEMTRQDENKRLYNVTIYFQFEEFNEDQNEKNIKWEKEIRYQMM